MNRAPMSALHAGLVQRTVFRPEPPARPGLPAAAPAPAEPPRLPAAWSAPTVVPFRPAGPAVRPARPKRKAMTLRLEPVRHQRLKAASAELRRSCQSIMVEALERWLAEHEGFRI